MFFGWEVCLMELWSRESGLNEENFKKMIDQAATQPIKYASLIGTTATGEFVEMEVDYFDALNGEFDFTGEGVLMYPNGNAYIGEFRNGKWHGKGKVVLGETSFVTHEGIWENGKMSYGIFRSPDGSEIYEGEWKSNSQTGKGTKTIYREVKGRLVKREVKCDSFVNGEPRGYAEETIEQGANILKLSCVYDERGHCKGTIRSYDKDGRLLSEAPFENKKGAN
jgi:hypothetical protein